MIVAELASTWPKLGGIYYWIKDAFDSRLAVSFCLIWGSNNCSTTPSNGKGRVKLRTEKIAQKNINYI